MSQARHPIVVCDLGWLRDLPIGTPESRARNWDQLHAISALQGLVNRSEPLLYLLLVGAKGETDRYWLKRMTEPGAWLAGREVETVRTLDELLAHFGEVPEGLAVWDPDVPATSNLASTLAGLENLLPVRFDPAPDSLYRKLSERYPVRRMLTAKALKLSGPSLKCEVYRWGIRELVGKGRTNPREMGNYPDASWIERPSDANLERTLLSNHDYFIAHKGFFFDLMPWTDEAPDDDPNQPPGEDGRTLLELLAASYEKAEGKMIHIGGFVPWDQKYTDFTGRSRGGVATEWRMVEMASNFNAYVDADAAGLHAMANASFFQHFPLHDRYPQRAKPSLADLRRQGLLGTDGRAARKPFVSIYVGDYDSSAWLYQMIPTRWDDPVRGEIPLGWAFNPNLADRFPVGMDYVRRTASENDTFVAGDSGAGYINPGSLEPPRKFSGLPSGLAAWVEHCKPYYRKWDLSITGFVIDGDAPPMNERIKRAYAEFCPDGVVAQKIPPTSLVGRTPFLRMGMDLDPNPEVSAERIAAELPREGASFGIYRTVLWTPTMHKRLFARLRELRPDVEIVEPHTLFLLLRAELLGPNSETSHAADVD